MVGRKGAKAQPSKAKRRVRIEDTHVDAICEAIASSGAAPSWGDVIALAERAFGHRWTRQALERRDMIKLAYTERHATPAKPPTDPAVDLLQQRIASQAVELERLRATIGELNDLFVRYQYNAHARGISPAELEAPLPTVPKRRSDG